MSVENKNPERENKMDLSDKNPENALNNFAWFVKWSIEASSEFVNEFIEERREEIENFCENHQLALCTLIASEKGLWKALVVHNLLPPNSEIPENKDS